MLYNDVIEKLHPDYVVHGDNWKSGAEKAVREHVERLVTLGLVSGYEDDTIKPLANITRAEIAKILFNLY